jgi:dipeptidase D
VLRVAPTADYKPTSTSSYVGLQGHMDMVCSCNEDTEHDFETEPILVGWNSDREGWLRSTKGTTLGADDGMGVATGLSVAAMVAIARSGAEAPEAMWALLSERTGDARLGGIKAGIEILLTVNEETDMSGALEIDRDGFLKCDRLLNIDTEEEHGICIGCAGGFEQKIEIPITRDRGAAEGRVILEYAVKGLFGGHSGIDINAPRASGIELAVRLALVAVDRATNACLAALSAGTAVNTIPRECSFSLVVAAENAAAVRTCVDAEWAKILDEYEDSNETVDPAGGEGMRLDCDQRDACADDVKNVADRASTLRALSMVHILPHGVLRASPMEETQVETSCNLAIVEMEQGKVWAHLFARSSRVSQLELVQSWLESIARLSGAAITEPFSVFPGWTPKAKSPLLLTAIEAYKRSYSTDKPPNVYSIHAGLECGILVDAYPGMQVVSWGPTIQDAHTPDESVLAETVPRVLAFTLLALAMM